jgi:D-alanyl-D-alanine carboxypeptidase
MTSDIPNYSETVQIGQIVAGDIHHQFSPQDLIAAAYDKKLPPASGYFYSNTNNILAALIIEAASGMSYQEALRTRILGPLALRNTFYSDGVYPSVVLDRLPIGIYDNQACLLYQPKPCTVTILAPLIGRDMSAENLSWAGAAGAMVSDLTDLALWVRDLFGVRVFPQKQLDEMTKLVSQKTGLPIQDTSATDPHGFGLDLGRIYLDPSVGSFWFYQGETLGYRVIFAYWPQYDLVITAATNSQPNEGQDLFGRKVVGGAFAILKQARVIHTGDGKPG